MVLGLLAALTTFAVPNVASWQVNSRLRSAASSLYSHIQISKMTAIKENAPVVMIFNTAANSYMAFVDNGEGGGGEDNGVRDGSERIIANLTMPANVTMYEAIFPGGVPQLRFDGRGFPNGNGGHVYMLNTEGRYMGVILNMIGRARIFTSEDGVTWV